MSTFIHLLNMCIFSKTNVKPLQTGIKRERERERLGGVMETEVELGEPVMEKERDR